MATEAEARETLVKTSLEILDDVAVELNDYDQRPLTGQELEDIIKKLYRVSGTLKTAQSLSPV